MTDTDKPIDFDEIHRQNRLNNQSTTDLLDDLTDSINVSREKSRELADYVAYNHEFLRGDYNSETSSLINGSSPYDIDNNSSLLNGANEGAIISAPESRLEDGSKIPSIVSLEDKVLESENPADNPDVGNMSNAYAYSADPAYMAAELAKTTVRTSDTYEGAHMVSDAIRMAQAVGSTIGYSENKDIFQDFATSDLAKDADKILASTGTSFDGYMLKDSTQGLIASNYKYSNDTELAQAFQSGKGQIERYLQDRGLDLAGIKNQSIAASLNKGSYTFGSQKQRHITADEATMLRAYLGLNNMELSMSKESSRVMVGRQVFRNRAKIAVKGSDTYRGYRQFQALKRAGGRIIFTPSKAGLRLTGGMAKVGNRITNVRYSFKMRGATSANKAKLSAELLKKNKAFAAKQSKRNVSLSKLSKVENFVTSSGLQKMGIIGSKISAQFKKTDVYKNTIGKRQAKKNQKKLEKKQKNPKKYQKKQRRRERRKKVSRFMAYFKKYIIIAAVVFGLILMCSVFMMNLITVFIGENPFSGEKLASTEYNSVRQQAMDNSILSLQDAQNWIINGTSGTYYTGSLYQATVKYPNGVTKTYKRGSADPSSNISTLFPDGDQSTIKKLRIPWTYNGTGDEGSQDADGYLGQSIYSDIYQLDENDEIIDDAPPLSTPRNLELYSDVINMPIEDGWISAFSTRPQYNYVNWQSKSTYYSGGSIRRYSLDDFYKAISSMAVEVCDITGYDDVDGQFYAAYFKAISDMAIKNSYYTISVTTVPKAGFMQFKDEDDNVYSDNAYLVHCQVYIHLDASINDLMELADHYDPVNNIFTDRATAIQAWRDWISATISATGADDTGYDDTRVYSGFFTADSSSFAYDSNYGSYRDASDFAYNYDNMTDEGNTACSYLYEGLTLDEWIDELGFVFLNAYSIDGNNVSNMAPIYSEEQIEDYLTQIKSYYYQSTGEELSEARIQFMRQCLGDVGRFYYAFGGKCSDINNPPVGLDCSGFVGYELAKAGLISDPVQSTGTLNGSGIGTTVSYDNKKPGDVIVKYDPENDTDLNWSSHVIIYLGKFDAGDGKGVVEHTVECTTSTVSGAQVYQMSNRSYAKGYDCVKSFMD